MAGDWMIYGATGYTGRLIAAEAVRQGLKPTLAGRNADKVRAVADPLGLPWASFTVDDSAAVHAALADQDAVLSVAGPFSHTADQMTAAAIATGTHYLDVTGELAVFEMAAGRHAEAESAGVALIPGVGFDVVPSDCLSVHAAARLENPVRLRLAIDALSGMSQGTAKTGVETLGYGTKVRENGEVVSYPVGDVRRSFDLGAGPKPFVGVTWGDVSTAYWSTGIENIAVYFPYDGQIRQMSKMARLLGPLLRQAWFQRFLKRQIDKQPPGPSDDERATTGTVLLAEVEDAAGRIVRSRLTTQNAYSLTADSAVTCVQKLLASHTISGYHTPATAFGVGLLDELVGCKLEDL